MQMNNISKLIEGKTAISKMEMKECCKQSVINAKRLYGDAKHFFDEKRYEASIVLSVIAMEELGKAYLKIGDQMWLCLPSEEKVIKIAGHMLRQSMMGSDFSYEDALESSELLNKYDVKLLGEEPVTVTFRRGTTEVISDHDCYLLELTARVKEVAYFRRKVWVDRTTFVPVREELFALSGKKLKEMELGDIARFGGRHYPLYGRLSNLLRRGSSTELVVTRAQFNLKLPAGTFSQRSLKP